MQWMNVLWKNIQLSNVQEYDTLHISGSIKVKVKVSLYMSWKHTVGVKVRLHLFLAVAEDGNKRSASLAGCFIPKEETLVHTE